MDKFIPAFIYTPLVVLTAFFHDNSVLRIINNTSAIVGLLHVSWLIRNTFSWLINTRYDFLYLFALKFNYLWMSIVFFTTSFVYQYLVFYNFIIEDDHELKNVIEKTKIKNKRTGMAVGRSNFIICYLFWKEEKMCI